MAPNVAKVDADRQLYLGTIPGYFRDEVVRWLLHGIQSAPPSENLLIPFVRNSARWLSLDECIGLLWPVEVRIRENNRPLKTEGATSAEARDQCSGTI